MVNTILLILCLAQIHDLKVELQNLKSNTGSQLSNILTNINNSYSYIEETLTKEASIVSKAEWEFGNIDVKAGTVEIKAYVIPKKYQPDVTQAFFVYDDEEIAAEYRNGKYEAIMNVHLFEDVSIPSVLFKENEVIRSESLDWFFNPRNELLPSVYASNWNPTYEIPYGSKQEIFVEVTMRCGIVYRSQISSFGMDEKGNSIEDNSDFASVEASIYDADGNLLYSVE